MGKKMKEKQAIEKRTESRGGIVEGGVSHMSERERQGWLAVGASGSVRWLHE